MDFYATWLNHSLNDLKDTRKTTMTSSLDFFTEKFLQHKFVKKQFSKNSCVPSFDGFSLSSETIIAIAIETIFICFKGRKIEKW